MIDIHSHILPRIDDGSKSVEESIKLISMLQSQGVDKIAATPHFYANYDTVDSFLQKREKSFAKLVPHLTESMPDILLGAEVKYYEGISRLSCLDKLKIDNSNIILLEMSMRKWSEYTLRELFELSSRGDLTIVLAHIERYLRFQSQDTLSKLVSSGIYIQANAEFFTGLYTRRKAVKMLNNNQIHFLGSDCHDLERRPPRIADAIEFIKKMNGRSFVSGMNSFTNSFFDK